jgi:hypothetical protein
MTGPRVSKLPAIPCSSRSTVPLPMSIGDVVAENVDVLEGQLVRHRWVHKAIVQPAGLSYRVFAQTLGHTIQPRPVASLRHRAPPVLGGFRRMSESPRNRRAP